LGSNKSAAIFSMEMSAESLTLRMISSLGRINQRICVPDGCKKMIGRGLIRR